MELLYRDGCMVVCLKPAGVLSEDSDKPCVPALLRQETGSYVGTVHRLDRVVGGVMVYCINEKLTGKLTQSFHENGEKTYLAVVSGDPGEAGTYTDLLYHDPKTNKTFPVRRMRRGVREAKLTFERLGRAEADGQILSLVRIHLQTGRTHQIRTQFAARKHPVVGDRRYGSSVQAQVALWSEAITVEHPQTKQRMTFRHAPPAVFPFDLFLISGEKREDET